MLCRFLLLALFVFSDATLFNYTNVDPKGFVATYSLGAFKVVFTTDPPEVLCVAQSGVCMPPATTVSFSPSGVAALNSTVALFADEAQNAIYSYTYSNSSVPVVVAGSGASGHLDGTASISQFNQPQGIAVNTTHCFVADMGNNAIRELNFGTNTVRTVCASASIVQPTSVALMQGSSQWLLVTAAGGVFRCDTGSSVVTRLTGGTTPCTAPSGVILGVPTGISRYNSELALFCDSSNNRVLALNVSSGNCAVAMQVLQPYATASIGSEVWVTINSSNASAPGLLFGFDWSWPPGPPIPAAFMPTVTPTMTYTQTTSLTSQNSRTPSPTPTVSPVATRSVTPSSTPTTPNTKTSTPSCSRSVSASVSVSPTPTGVRTTSPTASASITPTVTTTRQSTGTSTSSPSQTPTASSTPRFTQTVTLSPTYSFTPSTSRLHTTTSTPSASATVARPFTTSMTASTTVSSSPTATISASNQLRTETPSATLSYAVGLKTATKLHHSITRTATVVQPGPPAILPVTAVPKAVQAVASSLASASLLGSFADAQVVAVFAALSCAKADTVQLDFLLRPFHFLDPFHNSDVSAILSSAVVVLVIALTHVALVGIFHASVSSGAAGWEIPGTRAFWPKATLYFIAFFYQGMCLSAWALLLAGHYLAAAIPALLFYPVPYMLAFLWFHLRLFPSFGNLQFVPYHSAVVGSKSCMTKFVPSHYWEGRPSALGSDFETKNSSLARDRQDVTSMWGCFFTSFTPKCRAFGAAALVRAFVLGFVAGLPKTSCEVQLIPVIIVLGLYLCLLVCLRPYRSRGSNILQSLTVVAELATAFCLLLQYKRVVGASVTNGAVIFTFVCLIASNLWSLFCFVRHRALVSEGDFMQSESEIHGDLSADLSRSPSGPEPEGTSNWVSSAVPESELSAIDIELSDEQRNLVPSQNESQLTRSFVFSETENEAPTVYTH